MKKTPRIIGSALIEFILVIPIFFALIGGLIDTSILLYNKTIIIHASREGARYGVVIRSSNYAQQADVQSHAINYCNGKLISFGGASAVSVSMVSSVEDPAFGDSLAVTVNYQYNGLVFFLNSGDLYNLSSTTVMVYE